MDNDEPQPDSTAAAQDKEQIKNRILKPGESFGNYRVVKCHCAGLIAAYYRMQHVRDLHDVTVTVFHHRASEDQKLLKRLEMLKRLISSLKHESIPQIQDCLMIEERICLFMEPVSGLTLSQYFEAHASPGKHGLEPKVTTRLIAQLLGALGYAHSQGLDHRDLESELVFVKEDGSLCILGFGLKAAVGNELFQSIVSASVSPLVSTNMVNRLNSFDVMSPEYQAGGEEDFRVDIYCVGVIGYWLLTGLKPDLAKYEPPTKLVEDLSGRWNSFFEQSLERDTDKRYQSCKVALLALKETDDEPESEGGGVVQRQIDRIPVPRAITDRGAFASRMYRLCLIGFVGLTLTALAALFLHVTYTDEIDYTRDVAALAKDGGRVSLVVNIKPPVAKVEFIAFDESFVVNGGQLKLAVQPGKYKIRIAAPHHGEVTKRVEILEGNDQPEIVSVALKPAWTDVEIRSLPGASVSVVDANSQELSLGITDDEGIFSLRKGVFTGKYKVIVSKEGYASRILEDQDFELGELTQLEAPLAPNPGTVTLTSQPSGARIFINDLAVGTSPLILDDVIPSELYLVVARLDGYRSSGRRFEVKPGEELTVDFGELVPRSGLLSPRVSIVEGVPHTFEQLLPDLLVEVDEVQYPFNSPELETIGEGTHPVRLIHPLYESSMIEVAVEDGGEHFPDFELSPRPGFVDINIPDGLDAQIHIKGKVFPSEGKKMQISSFVPVDIELRIKDYLTMVRTIEVDPNETVTWDVSPVPIPGPVDGQAWILPYLGIRFAWLPKGSFDMGSPLEEHARLPNEGPQTAVTFSQGFWAGVFEVTQAQYKALAQSNTSHFMGSSHPVDGVTWENANAYCELLNQSERAAGRLPEGYVYRLPTEAEWEYAARAGTVTPFHFGDIADTTNGHFRGVYPRTRSDGSREAADYGTVPVGQYAQNAYGLFDVHGNVREWTLDAYNGRLEGDPVTDPAPRVDGKLVSIRGGGWEDPAPRVRSACRDGINPDTVSHSVGFRIFLAPEFP